MVALTGPAPMLVEDAARRLRAGELTSVELVEQALARADALDGRLGVYIDRFDAFARARARDADAELSAGVDRGPLHGIPVGIKDILATVDGPTTAQSLVLDPDWGAGQDAIAVERLRNAGAVVMGKTTTMEFASGLPDPDKPFPLPRNPWDTDAWPGGSSSGTGAGVAAGMFPVGLGTDTGGSIRIPAIYCGVSGLMPTFGLVPTAGCVPLGFSLDRVGPLARSARECGLMLAAIAGGDPRDPYAVDSPCTDYLAGASGSLRGVRVGLEREHHLGVDGEDPAVAGAYETAVTTLRELGATVAEVSLPHHAETVTAAMVIARCEATAYHMNDLRTRAADYVRSSRALLPLGACFSGADYVQAQRVRSAAQRALARVFEEVDVIAMPAASRVAPSYERLLEAGPFEVLRGMHTSYWNAVGNPALTVPMGSGERGLPLSLQLAARPFEEDRLVAVGAAYQTVTAWHLRVAPLVAACTSPDRHDGG